MKSYMSFMALGLLAACGSGEASPPSKAAGGASSSYAIAGVSLGMSAQEAKSKLAAAGYKFDNETYYYSYAQLLKQARGNSVGNEKQTEVHEQHYSKGNEKIQLQYAALPAGSVVENIFYTPPMAILSPPQAIAEMTKRYGAPTLDKSPGTPNRKATWCKSPLPQCTKTAWMSISQLGVDATNIWIEDQSIFEKQRASFSASPGSPKASF